jgi:hypothetical protein
MSATHLELNQSDLGRLHEAALEVILNNGIRDDSIGLELDLWHAFERATRTQGRLARWLGLGRPQIQSRQQRLDALARAAFEVARKHGYGEPGILLHLDLLFALQSADDSSTARRERVA